MNEELIRLVETLSQEEFEWLLLVIMKKIEEEQYREKEWNPEYMFQQH
jgi:hypothetical protein